jgi:hypothetical protein
MLQLIVEAQAIGWIQSNRARALQGFLVLVVRLLRPQQVRRCFEVKVKELSMDSPWAKTYLRHFAQYFGKPFDVETYRSATGIPLRVATHDLRYTGFRVYASIGLADEVNEDIGDPARGRFQQGCSLPVRQFALLHPRQGDPARRAFCRRRRGLAQARLRRGV